MNSLVNELHQRLIKTHHALSKRLGQTTDVNEAEAILREMEEVNFRVMMAGRLLFSQITAAIDKKIKGVIDASVELDEAIQKIERIKELVRAVGQFLGLADKALDAIKIG